MEYEIEKEHALKIIKAMRTNWDENSKTPNANALDMATKALEKQIPKECIDKIMYKQCPVCGAVDLGRYCMECGQAINWE